MVTFKLIKHKNRHKLCPRDLSHLSQRQLLRWRRQEARGGNPALPSFVSRRQEPRRAHLSGQPQRSSLSTKEPLRSTRLATGCHCYSTHTIASEPFCQGLEPDGTWAPLCPTSHGIVIPSGGTPPASSTFPTKATSLSHCLSIPIVLHQRGDGRERVVKRRKGPAGISHQRFSRSWTWSTYDLGQNQCPFNTF